MASRNKLLPVWGSHLGNTRACLNTCWGIHVGGKGVLLWTGKKFKDFQFCLPILPAYLPLKFPNGQFPLKTPGPISPVKSQLRHLILIFFRGQFFFFGFSFAWLIGPGIFRGNCPLGNFRGRYAGRIGRQNWKSLNLFARSRKYPFPTYV
jgi:hypothetical protein